MNNFHIKKIYGKFVILIRQLRKIKLNHYNYVVFNLIKMVVSILGKCMEISIEAQNKYTGSIPICPLLMFKISVDNAIERKQLIFVYY